MIAVVIQIPLVDGKPDLQLPAGVEVVHEGYIAHVSWGDQALTLRYLGSPASGPVFVGMMTAGVALKLAHLGAKVRRLRDVWGTPALRTWLLAHGVDEDESGAPVPPHVIAGSGDEA